MPKTKIGAVDSEVVEVQPQSPLDCALRSAASTGAIVEIVHGRQRYHLVPVTGDIDDARRAWRGALMARTLAHRDAQPPLGITTAQLIRESRGETDDPGTSSR